MADTLADTSQKLGTMTHTDSLWPERAWNLQCADRDLLLMYCAQMQAVQHMIVEQGEM